MGGGGGGGARTVGLGQGVAAPEAATQQKNNAARLATWAVTEHPQPGAASPKSALVSAARNQGSTSSARQPSTPQAS